MYSWELMDLSLCLACVAAVFMTSLRHSFMCKALAAAHGHRPFTLHELMSSNNSGSCASRVHYHYSYYDRLCMRQTCAGSGGDLTAIQPLCIRVSCVVLHVLLLIDSV
jgi:hypothetical protein